MLYTGHLAKLPAAVRYPRGAGKGVAPDTAMQALTIGKGRRLRTGKRVAILNFGTLMPFAEQAAEALDATLADMRFVKPLDDALIRELADEHELLVTLEDGCIAGGAGAGVVEFLQQDKRLVHTLMLGLPDKFIEQGTQQEMYTELGLDAQGIIRQVNAFLES